MEQHTPEPTNNCKSCFNAKTYTTGRDEYPPCATLAYCSKGHWENGDIPTEEEISLWDNCPDFEPKPMTPDTKAAEQFADILKRRGTLYTIYDIRLYSEDSVIACMTEFAAKEAQLLLKWVSAKIFISDDDNIFYFKEDTEGDNPMNEEDVLKAYQLYKEGKA